MHKERTESDWQSIWQKTFHITNTGGEGAVLSAGN